MDLRGLALADLLDRVAARAPTPGGGAVASCVGALAAALGRMALNYSISAKTLDDKRAAIEDGLEFLKACGSEMLTLAEKDALAYQRLNDLQKKPKNDPDRMRFWDSEVAAATSVPLRVMKVGVMMLEAMREQIPNCNRFLLSDLAIAAVLAEGTVRAAEWNVRVNVPLFAETKMPELGPKWAAEAAACVEQARRLASEVETACRRD